MFIYVIDLFVNIIFIGFVRFQCLLLIYLCVWFV